MARTRVSDATVKKKRGRPPGSRSSGVVTKTKAKAKPTTTKKPAKSKRVAQTEPEDELSIARPSQSSRVRKHKVRADIDEIAEPPPNSQRKYIQLESRTKRIPQEQIDTWPQISPNVLEQIVAVMRDAKKDIANTQRDERRVIAAHATLNPLVRKLERQLQASRIPPMAKDVHFNIDMLTERNAHISREVTTARHSKQLLNEQAKITESLLKKDEESLDELKRNAKEWKTEWKHQEKHGRLHPLLKDLDNAEAQGDMPEEISLKTTTSIEPLVLDTSDVELAPLLEQLRRSLEHIQGNHAQVEGIDEAMKSAQVALDDVLFRNTNAQQYAAI
ncbi:hypothetical protein ACN47E_005877 [Coniothyrium glycines]